MHADSVPLLARSLPFLRAFLTALLLAIGPFLLARFILQSHAERRGMEELHGAALRYVHRADRVISEATQALHLLHDRKQTDCSPQSREGFIEVARGSGFIDSVGMVDEKGLAMCLEPKGRLAAATLLPPYRKSASSIAMGIVGDAKGENAAVIGWALKDGRRLVARLAPQVLDIDPGPENLRDHMHAVVRLKDGTIWLEEGKSLRDEGGDWLEATRTSRHFPVSVSLSAPWSAAWEPIQPLNVLVTACSIAFGLIIMIVSLRMAMVASRNDSSEFLEAIVKQEFVPYYQPVVDIETGHLRGCEVLARWAKPDGTIGYPGSFMPFAETSGHIIEITRQLMRKTRDELGPLYESRPELKVSINLSAIHFKDRRTIEDIEEIFGDGPISYRQLVFEVTERQPLADMDKARKIIAEMHALGLRIALDDVGTGHSGLAYLQMLGVDIVKIDKMFIDTLLTDENADAIVDKLVQLAANLHMGIIAEGVEHAEQVDRLRELGVTAAQGFLFAPALPGKVYIDLAKAMAPPPKRLASDDEAEVPGLEASA